MPVNIMPAQNVGQFIDAAQQAGYAGTLRSDRRFAQQMAQDDRQFYDRMQFAAQQDDRNYQQQLGYLQERDQLERQRFLDQIETEQDNTAWEYTQEQQRTLRQLEEDDRRIDQLALDEGWDAQTLRDVKWQNYQKRTGITPQPMPKKDPWGQLPVVTVGGKKYRRAEGRNGRPEWIPEDPLELDPQEAAKMRYQAEMEAPLLEAEARMKREEAAQKAKADSLKAAMDIAKTITEMRAATVTKEDGTLAPAYTEAQIRQAEQQFLRLAGMFGALDDGGQAQTPQLTPVGNGMFVDAQGNVYASE